MLHLIHVWLSISFSGGVRLQHLSAAKNYIYRYRERSVPKMRDTFFFFLHYTCLYNSISLCNVWWRTVESNQNTNHKSKFCFKYRLNKTQSRFSFHHVSTVYLFCSRRHLELCVLQAALIGSGWAALRSLLMTSKQRHSSDGLLTAFYSVEVILPEAKV